MGVRYPVKVVAGDRNSVAPPYFGLLDHYGCGPGCSPGVAKAASGVRFPGDPPVIGETHTSPGGGILVDALGLGPSEVTLVQVRPLSRAPYMARWRNWQTRWIQVPVS